MKMEDGNYVTKSELRQLERKINGFRDAEDVSLKEHFDTRFTAIDKKLDDMEQEIDRRFEAEAAATKLAREAMNHRLDGMNEFRDSLRDQSITFVNKGECHLRHQKEEEEMARHGIKLESLELSRAAIEGKASQRAVYLGYAFTLVALIISIIALIVILV